MHLIVNFPCNSPMLHHVFHTQSITLFLGMLPLPGSSTFDPEEELEEPSMKLQRMEGE